MEFVDVAGSPSDHPIQEIFWPEACEPPRATRPLASHSATSRLWLNFNRGVGSSTGTVNSWRGTLCVQLEAVQWLPQCQAPAPAGQPGCVWAGNWADGRGERGSIFLTGKDSIRRASSRPLVARLLSPRPHPRTQSPTRSPPPRTIHTGPIAPCRCRKLQPQHTSHAPHSEDTVHGLCPVQLFVVYRFHIGRSPSHLEGRCRLLFHLPVMQLLDTNFRDP